MEAVFCVEAEEVGEIGAEGLLEVLLEVGIGLCDVGGDEGGECGGVAFEGGDVVGGCGGREGCGGEGEDVCGEGFGGMDVEWVGLCSWDWCTL